MIVEAIIVLAVAFLFSYAISYFLSGQTSYKGKSPIYTLSKAQQVLSSDDLPWNTGPCALRFGIFISEAPRTIAKVDCIQIAPTSPITSFAPSCSDYTYQTCECDNNNCSRCSMQDDNNSFLSKLVSIGDRLELWASGYTSQNDKPNVPVLLKVRTAKDSTKHYMESVALPAIPLQRWTIVTIVKEGRRFDVYYGQKQVTSKLLQYIPVTSDYGQPWFAGNPKWKGQIGFFNGYSSTWSSDQVADDVRTLVDTKGVPLYLSQNSFSIPDTEGPLLPDCLLGNCNEMPSVKPNNPFAVYQSNVS
jgi:hypothetical protein